MSDKQNCNAGQTLAASGLLGPSEFTRNQEDMKQHGLPVKNRYAEGWCEGKYFCIEVAPGETLAQLKKHFRETVGHDRIQVRRWYWA